MRQVTEFMPDIDLNDVIKALGNPVRRKNSVYAQGTENTLPSALC